MGKKIVISESQYRRVFLSEQNKKDNGNGYTHRPYNPLMDKAAGVDPSKSKYFSGALWLNDPLPIEDLFDYHIKTKEEGNHFREWVRSDNKRLSKVAKAIRNEGWSGTLDKTGDHKNKYIKLAWKLVGQEYLNTNKGKGWQGVDDYAGLDVSRYDFEQFSDEEIEKREKELKKKFITDNPEYDDIDIDNKGGFITLEQFKKSIRDSYSYKYYLTAKKQRNSVKGYFGWTDPAEISSKEINKILSNEIAPSTCINPENILADYKIISNSLYQNSFKTSEDYSSYGDGRNVFNELNIFKKTFSDYTQDGSLDKEYESWYRDYQSRRREYYRKCPEPEPDRVDYGEDKYIAKRSSTYVVPTTPIYKDLNIKSYDDEESEDDGGLTGIPKPYVTKSQWEACSKVQGIGFLQKRVHIPFSSTFTEKDKENVDNINTYFKNKNKQSKVEKKLKDLGYDVTKSLLTDIRFYNMYSKIIDIIDTHNLIIGGQTKKALDQLCDNPTKKVWVSSPNVSYSVAGAGSPRGYYGYETIFKWKDVCKNRGGIFLYPTKSYEEKGSTISRGWVNNEGYCCCVRGFEDQVSGKKLIDWCGATAGDTRPWYDLDRIGEGIGECIEDWHCVADVLSIAAYAFGPWGALISAVIDGISALGYVLEGEKGWQLNAGLTAIGMLGGIGEVTSLVGKGAKFANKLEDLASIGAKYIDEGSGVVKNSIKMQREIAKWADTLTDAERKLYKDFIKVNKEIESKGGRSWLEGLSKEVNKLDKVEQGVFAKMMGEYSENPSGLRKLYQESGEDLHKMVNKYYKGTRQVILQSALFTGVHVFSEEIGSWVAEKYKAQYEFTGLDPFGIMSTDLTKEEQDKIKIDFSELIELELMKKVPDYVNSKKDLNIVLDCNYKVFEIYNNLIKNVDIKDKVDTLYSTYGSIVNGSKLVKSEDFVKIKDLWVKLSKENPTDESFSTVFNELETEINSFKSKTPISNLDKVAIVVTEDSSFTYNKLEEKLNKIEKAEDLKDLEFDDLLKNEGFMSNKILINRYNQEKTIKTIINKWTL